MCTPCRCRKICSVCEQIFLFVCLQKTNLKQTVEFKNEYTFTSYEEQFELLVVLITCIILHNTIWPGHLLCVSCLLCNNRPISQRLLPIHSLFYYSWHFYDQVLCLLNISRHIKNNVGDFEFCIVTETCSNFLE